MVPQTFALIDSTLREGEQFARAHFTTAQKIQMAHLLDAFGVEYLEVTSPLASRQSRIDCETIARLGLRARLLAHTRCRMEDVRAAVESGVDGVNVVIGTSALLREHSHGRGLDEIRDLALEVIGYLRAGGIESRFSTEDSLRTDPADLFPLYEAVDALGVERVGIADTVGVGTPRQVHALVAAVRARVRADIEFHGHNDAGCAVANAHAALEGGATHIDVTVLGIGERNGITPLGGLIARLYSLDPALVARYRLALLPALDRLVADIAGVEIPFNNCITGASAFTHRAGIHTNAVLRHPATYEALRPEDFGLARTVEIGHRLTGRHAVRHRALALGIDLPPAALRAVTQRIKQQADRSPLTMDEVDAALRDAASLRPVGGRSS